MKRIGGLVATGVILGLIGGYAMLRRDDERNKRDAAKAIAETTSNVWSEPVAKPIERAPVFGPGQGMRGDAASIAKAEAAEHAVYDYCERFFVFREGSTLTGDYVPVFEGTKRTFPIANVSVKVFDDRKTGGNVLWYEVRFTSDGKPSAIVAHKDASARACGMPAAEAVQPL